MLLKLESVFQDLFCGVLVIDAQGTIVRANSSSLEILECTNEKDIIGKNSGIFFDIHIGMSQKQYFAMDNKRIQTLKGKHKLVNFVLFPLKDRLQANNYYLLVINSINNITFEKTIFDDYFIELGLVSDSSLMQEVGYLIKTVATTESTVLLLGETGTGKDIAAQIIHKLSPRNSRPLHTVNCAALPESLLESELFGHVKGAFTGANRDRKGLFEMADGATVFLDEIGEISPVFQAKLLRILQNKEFQRIGSSETMKTDVRIITATNKDLKQMVNEKLFREDLYYRLNVFPITIPPLRKRKSDLPNLIKHFIGEFNQKFLQNKLDITEVALTLLFNYSFPGNIRELKNIIEHAFIKSQGTLINPQDLPKYFLEEMDQSSHEISTNIDTTDLIEALKIHKGNKSKAAEYLGISRKTLYNRLEKLNKSK